jgi:hypothetical protein
MARTVNDSSSSSPTWAATATGERRGRERRKDRSRETIMRLVPRHSTNKRLVRGSAASQHGRVTRRLGVGSGVRDHWPPCELTDQAIECARGETTAGRKCDLISAETTTPAGRPLFSSRLSSRPTSLGLRAPHVELPSREPIRNGLTVSLHTVAPHMASVHAPRHGSHQPNIDGDLRA